MIVLIDTSSLISLVRYYLLFDKDQILYNFIKDKIESKQILVLDKVYKECERTAKGIVIEELKYLKSKKNITNTTEILPTQKFFNQLENQFINGSVKNKLSDVEFDNRKNDFLNSADAKLLLYSISDSSKPYVIVSEETETSNDNKSFKKLPSICKILDLDIITLPKLLKNYKEINLIFNK